MELHLTNTTTKRKGKQFNNNLAMKALKRTRKHIKDDEREELIAKGTYYPKKAGCCWNFFGRRKPKEDVI